MSINLYNAETNELELLAGASEIPRWSGTQAEFNVLDKSTLAEGTIIEITDDLSTLPTIDDTTPATDKVYSSSKVENKLSNALTDIIVSEVIEYSYTISANSTYTKTGFNVDKDGYTLILAICEATGGNEVYCYNCMITSRNLLNLQFKNTTSSSFSLTARIRCLYRKN